MSVPPGWHPQPDGRERWWDGQAWTDHVRDPSTAHADETAVLPAGDPSGGTPQGDAPTQAYAPTPAGGPPQPGYAQPGYGQPGYASYPPPKQGMSTGAKGCLIAAVVGIVLLLLALVVGFFVVARTVDRVSQEVSTAFPTDLPTAFPTDLPTEVPTTVPSDLPSFGGEPVTVAVGEGFELPRVTVDRGWEVDAGTVTSSIRGMSGTVTSQPELPVVFSVAFERNGQEPVRSLCTGRPAEQGDDQVSFTCLPVLGDVSGIDEVTVTPGF